MLLWYCADVQPAMTERRLAPGTARHRVGAHTSAVAFIGKYVDFTIGAPLMLDLRRYCAACSGETVQVSGVLLVELGRHHVERR